MTSKKGAALDQILHLMAVSSLGSSHLIFSHEYRCALSFRSRAGFCSSAFGAFCRPLGSGVAAALLLAHCYGQAQKSCFLMVLLCGGSRAHQAAEGSAGVCSSLEKRDLG